jgi:hypothetical protein
MKCTCPDWKPNIEIISGPFILQQLRQPGSVRPCKQFEFCPWCGSKLIGTNEVKEFVPPVPVRPQTNRCGVCGTPTFGLYCAKHTKGGHA